MVPSAITGRPVVQAPAGLLSGSSGSLLQMPAGRVPSNSSGAGGAASASSSHTTTLQGGSSESLGGLGSSLGMRSTADSPAGVEAALLLNGAERSASPPPRFVDTLAAEGLQGAPPPQPPPGPLTLASKAHDVSMSRARPPTPEELAVYANLGALQFGNIWKVGGRGVVRTPAGVAALDVRAVGMVRYGSMHT